jgi:hypothetical protein
MNGCRFSSCLIGALVLVLTSPGVASGATIESYDEDEFKAAYSGALTMESFETIAVAQHASPIPALDPTDPDYDLDGNFALTAHSTFSSSFPFFVGAYQPWVDPVDGSNYLYFSPWYAGPALFDADNPTPIMSFHDFGGSDAWLNAFGFYLYNYTPDPPPDPDNPYYVPRWIVMEFAGPFGTEYTGIDLFASAGVTGSYFYGVITDTPFSQVRLHTNQNGSTIEVDEIYFGVVPEPGSMLLTVLGLSALALHGRRRKR